MEKKDERGTFLRCIGYASILPFPGQQDNENAVAGSLKLTDARKS